MTNNTKKPMASSNGTMSSNAKASSSQSQGLKKPAPKSMPSSASDSCKCEAGSDCCLCDQDIIADVLGSAKSLITLYTTALCESSCKNMRNLVDQQLSECAKDQFDMFLYMNERGMYPTEAAAAQKVSQAKTKFATAKKSMCK